MRITEIPYHPGADLTTDSLIRVQSCVTRLEMLLNVITEWVAFCGPASQSGDGADVGKQCGAQPPACLAKIRRKIEDTLRRISEGPQRPSERYVAAVGVIDRLLHTHEDEFVCARSSAHEAYGNELRKALTEAVALRDRIAAK